MGDHSINVLCVAGPDLSIYYADPSWPGSTHDARAYTRSTLREHLVGGWRLVPDAVILGDSAYPCTSSIIPPIRNAPNLTDEQRRFNRAHRRTRFIVECAYGVLKKRWPCLLGLRFRSPGKCALVVKACIVLHNLCLRDFPADVVDMSRAPADTEDEPEDEDEQENQQRRTQLVRYFRRAANP